MRIQNSAYDLIGSLKYIDLKPLELLFGLLRFPVDLLLAIVAFFLAYQTRLNTDLIPGIQLPVSVSTFPEYSEYLTFTIIASLGLVMLFSMFGLYRLKRPEPLHKQLSKIFLASLIWLFAIITYYFLLRTFPFSRLALLQSWLFAYLLISVGRIILQFIQNALYKKGVAQTRVLVIGKSSAAQEVIDYFFKNPQYLLVKHLENTHDIEKVVIDKKIEKVIECRAGLSKDQETGLLDFCREHQIEYSFIPGELEMQRTNIDIETPAGIPLITFKPTPLEGWGRILKRFFDFVGALCLLIVLFPVLLIIAILIKIDDPKGTIIFKFLDDGSRVKRVGHRSKPFPFYKFRTMKPGTHNMRYGELAHLDARQGTPMVKIKNDPRVTKIGKILRATSLDELPQLFNVLKGEMSLVGPRPHLPEEVVKYQKHHRFVLTVKPGITGMGQISGRSDLDFEQEVKLDSYYIENWSLLLDLKILIKTVLVVFKKYEE